MRIAVSEAITQRARRAHNLFILSVFTLHLPVIVATLAYSVGGDVRLLWSALTFLLLALAVLFYIQFRAGRLQAEGAAEWFVMLHWQLAARRGRLLLIGYLVAALMIGGGLLVGLGMVDRNMQVIVATVFTRIGVVPALLMILVTAILAGQSMHLANRGIAPLGMIKRFPLPPEVVVLDAENESGE